MQPAHKLKACSCGNHADTVCGGCGVPVCRPCSHLEISSQDLKAITIVTFCSKCKDDPRINTWGNVSWDTLISLYM